MNKLKGKQLGFSVVEVILVVAIVVLIGVIGWFVFKNQNKTISITSTSSSTKTPTLTNKIATTAPTQSSNPYAGWNLFTDSSNSFSVYYPNTWTVKLEPNNNQTMTCDSGIQGSTSQFFIPNDLSNIAKEYTGILVEVFKDSPSNVFSSCVIAGQQVSSDPTKSTINGYPSLFQQIVITKAQTNFGGNTTNSYVVSNNGESVLFTFEEQQVASSNGSYPGFNTTATDNANFVKLVNSIKFIN